MWPAPYASCPYLQTPWHRPILYTNSLTGRPYSQSMTTSTQQPSPCELCVNYPSLGFATIAGKTGFLSFSFLFFFQCRISFNVDKYLINTKCEGKNKQAVNAWPLNSASIQKSRAEAGAWSQRRGEQTVITDKNFACFPAGICLLTKQCSDCCSIPIATVSGVCVARSRSHGVCGSRQKSD